MTEQKTIWHEPTDIPAIGREIVFPDGMCMEVPVSPEFFRKWDLLKYKEDPRWCYLDDLLEQSNKVERLESEVSGYRNVLIITKLFIGASCQDTYDSYIRKVETGQVKREDLTIESGYATKLLEKITQALEKEEK